MRALLAGIGTTRRVGRFSAAGSVSVGYSFNHLTMDSAAGPAFALTGANLTDARVHDSAILKPDVAVWYDVTKHMGVGVSAAYLVARPEEIVTMSRGSIVRHLQTDAFELTAGVTFGVWRKRE
jgi:hypothetical protein